MLNRLKELGIVVWGTILALLVVALLSGGTLLYKEYFGVKNANIDRQIYEESKSYVKGVAKDLTNYRFELSQTTDETERKAIIRLINSRFADFDANDLDDPELRAFLRDVRNGYIK